MSSIADPTNPLPPGLETVILPRSHDIGGFEVRRALPAKERQMVGPFIFFDQMGPGEFLTGTGVDVRPHPHIGLSTVTYLFEGEILHRDSLGTELPIAPGDVNWMTAGQGIVHSERTAAARRAAPHRLSGIQSWVALPKAHEETAPAFMHHGSAELPRLDAEGVKLRLVAGQGWGLSSPVATLSELFYADAVLAPGAQLPMPDQQEERGAYVFAGSVEVAGQVFEAGRMLVFRAGDRMSLRAGPEGARLLLLGGATMDGPRYLFWNFVSSSRDRIEQAKADWERDRFNMPVPGETEWIPLPERKVVRAGERSPTS
ncbi:pirin family protein [Falsiroseomonas tokyonensis]|uniref:Pirin family protein n=1 Tax=Falsiroseomonas tokyonensis TaxID=430521 RepID=A0ABV7BST8_9PROT|nr:pirin family protein [Falsiroseomonas tokyonensis]MBU8538241.1 pirin family protein [Falsiroseomonas tokyonensis]